MHARQKPRQTAIVFEGEEISWAELWKKVEQDSRFFSRELGSDHQKIVALLITNSIEFVSVYLAILHAGHMAMPLDPVYKKMEIDAILERVNPSMLVLQPRYKDSVGEYNLPVVHTNQIKSDSIPAQDVLRLSPKDQVASLTFTSGTSGQPKVVPNTHANHIWNIKVCSRVWNWTSDDTLLITLPLSHMHGIVIGLSGILYHGNTMYLRQQSFDAKAVLEELSSGRISIFTHGPIGYMKMLDQAGEYDLSKVRLLISGSAPFPPKLWHDFKKRFGVEVIETYGTSETGRIAANSLGQKMLGSPGKILPTVSMKLSDDSEVLIKSGGVFPGYWNNKKATAEATTADGYWRTGDIGELKNGYLFLKGRIQEQIRRFGYTVSPRDVEWALLENPKINEAHVMGRQHPGRPNDELFYFISGAASEKEIMEYVKANLPFNWRPDHIVLLNQLPRTKNGKPHVNKLKEMAANHE